MTTTLEEAKQCPKCGKTGKVTKDSAHRDSRGRPCRLLTVECVTELCIWYDTQYFIQVNEDGSIPEPYSQLGEKQFPRHSVETQVTVQRSIEQQLIDETKDGGGTVR
jgi:endogenous inhibitor of DNA gyrase (YacG/DUF329 family)